MTSYERQANLLPIIGIERLCMGRDGTGVRTLIGTYGCTLRCKYCLNPQSWHPRYKPALYTPEQLLEKISMDNLYFQATGGGPTFGGGEPLLHMDAVAAFAALCPDSWNLWAETALNVDRELVQKASAVFHHFVVDIKTTDADIYRAYTGRDLKEALDNLLFLADQVGTERITVRVPLIPGYADDASRQQTIRAITALGFTDIDAFRYRTDIGSRKVRLPDVD